MPGFIHTLPVIFTDDSMKRNYPDDDDLQKGHVFLWDCLHPESGLAGGVVPPNATMLKNQAQDPAKQLIAGATNDNLRVQVQNNLVIGGATPGAIAERTAKGGLHVIITKTNDVSAGNDFQFYLPANVRDYLLDNPTHEFCVKLMGRKTRVAGTPTSADFFMLQTTSVYKFAIQATGNIPDSVGAPENLVGSYNSPTPPSQAGNFVRVHSFKGFKGAIPADRSLIVFRLKWGSGGPYGGFELNNAPSFILYRAEIEDLTATGRTHAAALAAFQAKAAVDFGVGGRFYNDTFTDPATLA